MSTSPHLLAGLMGLATLSAPSAAAQSADDAPEPMLQDIIIVTTSRAADALTQSQLPEAVPFEGPDASLLVTRVPGAARVGNGALSGQVQYRGLFGERLNLRVDGQRFGSAGPNLMDPPFHYAPAPLIAALVVDRGVSPVSEGPGLAGGADVVFKRIDYADGPGARLGYDLTASARSIDESFGLGGVVGAASEDWRFNLLGAYEEGDDTEFPGGTIATSDFERGVFGAEGGIRLGAHEFSLSARRQNTGPTGNPPFPMDIRFFDTDLVQGGYSGTFGDVHVEAGISYADVFHGMNNFDQRPPPEPARQRETFADATTRGANIAASLPFLGGKLSLGADHEQVDHNVRITNPNNADFFLNSLPDIEVSRTGVFGEWTGGFGPFESEIGLRADAHDAKAGEAQVGAAVPMGPRLLADAFNAADRSNDETTADAAARLWTRSENGLSWRATLARKTRVPNYLERFAWLPTGASGGLADGNIYVGDLGLEPETAWIAEAGFDYASSRAYLRPTVYYRQVEDYIQGVPFDATPGVPDSPQEMVASMNGDPTPLRFANVDARLYGFDVDAGMVLAGPWRVDAVANYVRGERDDIDDNLYRVAPARVSAALTYETARWSASFETLAVAEQDEVSATNSEAPTAGYVVLNLFGDWQVAEGIRLSAGVENLLDQKYEDHLAGYNRIVGSDVAVGGRLPGAGHGAFVRISVSG